MIPFHHRPKWSYFSRDGGELFQFADLFVEGVFPAGAAVFGQLEFFRSFRFITLGDVVEVATNRAL